MVVLRGSADWNANKSIKKYFCGDFAHHNLMPSYWKMHHLNNKVHSTLMFILCVSTSQNSVFSSPKRYMTFGTKTVLHSWGQMQRHRHKPITATDSQMTGLYLIHTAWQKIKTQIREINQRKCMSSHFISGLHGSLITTARNTWRNCTQLFSDVCDTEVVKHQK